MMDSFTKKEILERKKVKKKMSKAQMQLAIIKKKECDAKALLIVEQLLEPNIDSQWLLMNLRYINKSHMEDVIEERAITKLCGYVLCNNMLTTIIDQRYHISTKKNKVYDVTRRKNLCSARCYGACNYLLEQMLTSPLWLRDKEDVPEFKILPAKEELEKSIPGDEIDVRDINVIFNSENKQEGKKSDTCTNLTNISFNTRLNVNEHSECSIKNSQTNNESTEANNTSEEADVLKTLFSRNVDERYEDTQNLSNNSENKTCIIQGLISEKAVKNWSKLEENTILDCTINEDDIDINKDISSINDNVNQNVENDFIDKLESEKKIDVTKKHIKSNLKDHVQEANKRKFKDYKQRNSVSEKQSNEFYNLAMHIECSVREWITRDTICLLLGEEDVKNRLLDGVVQHDRYLHLCKKLNKLQLEDEKDDSADIITSILKPLPHLSVLQEEGKKMEIKVRAFYKGSTVMENLGSISKSVKDDNDFTPVLPLTDAHAPKMLRRRIFLDKLNRILPDLLRALANNKLPQYEYNREKIALIKVLINTFSLSAANIMFKTAEWTLVGLIVIKMLSVIDAQLKFLLSTKQATMYISMILMSYKLDSNYLDRLVMELTNNAEITNTEDDTNFKSV